MLYRLQLTYGEILDILDVRYVAGSTFAYTSLSYIYENSHIILMFMSLFPNKVKVNIKIDDNRLKSRLTTNKTIRFTEKTFFL